jgi:ubiquinone/menaquinone biosynthesis C-methylase UbiE
LPYEDDRFDGAFLTTVLGEIPDPEAALGELARVLKPQGRLVVGELFGDPHWVSPRTLQGHAKQAGLEVDSRVGTPLAYFARLRHVEMHPSKELAP